MWTWVVLAALGQGNGWISNHQEAWNTNDHLTHVPVPTRDWIGGALRPKVVRTVYGYYPYWANSFDELRWDLLTHIAYFAVGMNADGTLGARRGWPDQGFVETAHRHGVKVDLSFTLFSGDGIHTLCSNQVNRARAIDNMIDQMILGEADGINVDFEGLQTRSRDCFTDFIRGLRQGLVEAGHPDAIISIAGAAVDWGDAFDLEALAEAADIYFIMGYGYHWAGSGKAGPVGQLRVGAGWRPHLAISMARSLDHYVALVPKKRAVIVWGVPYYGYEWPTESEALYAATVGDGVSRTYSVAMEALAQGRRRQWDAESENAWYAFQSNGQWRQSWYDDEESLAAKYQLALEQEIGGVGIWALGYDAGHQTLWNLLDAYFGQEPPVLEGSRQQPQVITVPFEHQGDTRAAPSNYFNRYGCRSELAEYGREQVYVFSTCAPGTLRAEVTDGAGVDIDLHLLSGLEESDCLSRNDRQIEQVLLPGRYYLVADSYVADYVSQEGPYTLTADFEPSGPGCRDTELCVEGRCEAAPVDNLPGLETEAPVVLGEVPVPVIHPSPVPVVPTSVEDSGCVCYQNRSGLSLAWLLWPMILRLRPRSSAAPRPPRGTRSAAPTAQK